MNSPFEALLANLVSGVEGAEAAVMSAYDGEPVSEVVAPGEHGVDRYAIQLAAAQFRATFDRIDDAHKKCSLPSPRIFTMRSPQRVFFVHHLSDRYFILLSVKGGFGLVGAEYILEKTAHAIAHEM